MKVYNNDDIAFFSLYQRFQSPCVIMCYSPIRDTLSHSGLANVDTRQGMLYPLINLLEKRRERNSKERDDSSTILDHFTVRSFNI